MAKRWIAAVLGGVALVNGAVMLIDGPGWYDAAPGVADTGPYNPHFVADVGAAFFIAGLALAARAWRARYWPAGLAGAGFLAAHALIHVAGILGGHTHHAAFEWASVILPAAVAFWAALPSKGEVNA